MSFFLKRFSYCAEMAREATKLQSDTTVWPEQINNHIIMRSLTSPFVLEHDQRSQDHLQSDTQVCYAITFTIILITTITGHHTVINILILINAMLPSTSLTSSTLSCYHQPCYHHHYKLQPFAKLHKQAQNICDGVISWRHSCIQEPFTW